MTKAMSVLPLLCLKEYPVVTAGPMKGTHAGEFQMRLLSPCASFCDLRGGSQSLCT